jgi:hypothetical protein
LIERGHVDIARAFFELPESSAYGVGGGLAAIAHGLIDRATEDIDLFRDRRRAGLEPQQVAEAFALSAEARGWDVEWVRRFPEYARLEIVTSDVSLLVDIAFDTFELPFETTELGPTLAGRDVAVGKVVALFDRAEARDFADVFVLARWFDRDDLLERALARDGGLREEHLAERLRRMTEVLQPVQLPAGQREQFEEIRTFFEEWRASLMR